MRRECAVAAGKPAEAVEDRQFVIALARGLRVLQAFGPGDDLLSHAAIARRVQLPKATVTRLAHTLCKLGYLSRDVSGDGYRLDPHILTLGFPVLARLGVRTLARPMMQALADRYGVTVSIGLRDGTHMVFVERVRSSAPVLLQQDVGTRIPIAGTALGHAHLAGLPEAERAALMQEICALSLPEHWRAARKAIERELARYSAKGYCFGGRWRREITGVGVPLALPGRSLLAVSCAGLRANLPDRRLDEIGGRLKALVERLARTPQSSL